MTSPTARKTAQAPKHAMITRRRRRLISAPVNADQLLNSGSSTPSPQDEKSSGGPIKRNAQFRASASNLSRGTKRPATSTIIVRRSPGASSPKTYVITTTNPAETTAILRQHGLTSYRICPNTVDGSTDSGIAATNGSRKSSAANSKKSSPSDSTRNSPTNSKQTYSLKLDFQNQQAGEHARSPPIESPSTEHSNLFGSDSPGSYNNREVG